MIRRGLTFYFDHLSIGRHNIFVLGKPPCKKSAVFFNVVQTAIAPPYFENICLTISKIYLLTKGLWYFTKCATKTGVCPPHLLNNVKNVKNCTIGTGRLS